ncbi:hypothetical protein ACFL1H_04605, partial [Nanoarchaeota archaeon]
NIKTIVNLMKRGNYIYASTEWDDLISKNEKYKQELQIMKTITLEDKRTVLGKPLWDETVDMIIENPKYKLKQIEFYDTIMSTDSKNVILKIDNPLLTDVIVGKTSEDPEDAFNDYCFSSFAHQCLSPVYSKFCVRPISIRKIKQNEGQSKIVYFMKYIKGENLQEYPELNRLNEKVMGQLYIFNKYLTKGYFFTGIDIKKSNIKEDFQNKFVKHLSLKAKRKFKDNLFNFSDFIWNYLNEMPRFVSNRDFHRGNIIYNENEDLVCFIDNEKLFYETPCISIGAYTQHLVGESLGEDIEEIFNYYFRSLKKDRKRIFDINEKDFIKGCYFGAIFKNLEYAGLNSKVTMNIEDENVTFRNLNKVDLIKERHNYINQSRGVIDRYINFNNVIDSIERVKPLCNVKENHKLDRFSEILYEIKEIEEIELYQ